MSIRAKRFFDDIENRKVTVCGIGISNRPLIDKLIEHGAIVTACDKRERGELGDVADALEAKGVKLHLGKGYLDDLDGEIIFRTPGMNYNLPQLISARENGSIITSEMEVFFAMCSSRIIGLTGSDGKTTTTVITSKMLETQGYKVWVGGNIGTPLLPHVQNISPQDFTVVELSSFQLMSMRQSPNVAVVTNVAPNHLDMHRDMDEYVDAKRNILAHQDGFGMAVLNEDNDISIGFKDSCRGLVRTFSRRHKVENGAYCDEHGDIYFSEYGKRTYIMNAMAIRIPGAHNIENYLTAICAVWDYVDIGTIIKVAREFGGVEHRIELVRELDGVKYYNDSIASSPSRTIAGLEALKRRVILIAGGYDKHIPFDTLGQAVADHVKALILIGLTADKIEAAVRRADGFDEEKTIIIRAGSMADAVKKAHDLAQSGDIVTMSPACASFDMYNNFEERGRDFKELVMEL